MSGGLEILIDGTPVDQTFYEQMIQVEVEENVDLPGALLLKLPVSATDASDLTYVNDTRLRPLASIAVVATQDGKPDECIFDGYVLQHKLHLETGSTSSTLQVWAQDSSWLMNLEEKVREWVNVTDANVALSIFESYGITAAHENSDDDSPSHTEDGRTLMQRGSDIQFLRQIARRNGKLCRVACKDTPGKRIGYFAKPQVQGAPVLSLALHDPESPSVDALDFEWDVTRPSAVKARQALLTNSDADGVSVSTSDSGLAALDDQSLADFVGQPMTALLTTTVADAGELKLRSAGLLRESGWFARCEGEADVARLGAVIRAGTVVSVDGAGALNSGKYFVWSVRHTCTLQNHTMHFSLVRNALGKPPASIPSLGGLP